MEELIGYLKMFLLEMGGQIGKSIYADEGRDSNFCHFGVYMLNE